MDFSTRWTCRILMLFVAVRCPVRYNALFRLGFFRGRNASFTDQRQNHHRVASDTICKTSRLLGQSLSAALRSRFEDMIQIGDSIELSKQITEDDVRRIVEISGDDNPLHTSDEFAKRTLFKGRIAHGILSAALVSAALTKLFGPGNVWMSQTMKFTFPVRIGETVTARLRITSIDKRNVATVETKVLNQDGRVVLDGFAESKVMRIRPLK